MARPPALVNSAAGLCTDSVVHDRADSASPQESTVPPNGANPPISRRWSRGRTRVQVMRGNLSLQPASVWHRTWGFMR